MFTIAAQIVLHSVVEAMDWRNNVYVPCAQIVVNSFCHCYCDQFRFRQTLKAYISEKRFAAGCLVVIPGSFVAKSDEAKSVRWDVGV